MFENKGSKLARALVLALALVVVVPAVTAAVWPVTNPNSYISRGFSDGHRGIDIASPRWTGVVPIASGSVVYAGWRNNCGGYQVWINHRNGYYSAYYHLAREISTSGQAVAGGATKIGYVGTTGCVTGSHLHVEVWRGFPWKWGSYRVNPWPYIDDGAWLPYRYQ
jgi:murein DD-endopeptidase MepM/ murein hydrolase activator NlpD